MPETPEGSVPEQNEKVVPDKCEELVVEKIEKVERIQEKKESNQEIMSSQFLRFRQNLDRLQ